MNNKQSTKINIIDILLIVAALAVAAIISVYLFADRIQDGFSPKKNIYIYANAVKIDGSYAYEISKGDKLYNTENGELIGTVTRATLDNSYDSIINPSDGAYENVYYPDLYDITLIIAATVSENYDGCIKTGARLSAGNKKAAYNIEIVSVTAAEEFIEISPSYGQRTADDGMLQTESEG